MVKLTDEMHDAVLNSNVGQYIDRLIREEGQRQTSSPSLRAIGILRESEDFKGNVIQALWEAFMSGAKGKSFREIKTAVSNGTGGFVSGE